jgi:hypothetical protein
MEKEVPIIALIYIERLVVRSGFGVSSKNWRKVVFIALIIASKIWDDESFENNNFAKAFPSFSVKSINQIERIFLDFVGYTLYIASGDYARYYFILRAFAEKTKRSFPLRPLEIDVILKL